MSSTSFRLSPIEQSEQIKANENKYISSIQEEFIKRFKTFCTTKELIINEFIYTFYVPNVRYFHQNFFQWYNECLNISSNQNVITFLMLLLLNDTYYNFLKTMTLVAWDGNYDATKDVFITHMNSTLIMYEYFYKLLNKFNKAISKPDFKMLSVPEKYALLDVIGKYKTQTKDYIKAIISLIDPSDSTYKKIIIGLDKEKLN